MNKNQKLLLVILAFYVLGDFTAVSITNLYLWQKFNDFHTILFYNSVLFLGMAVSGFFSSFLGARIGSKLIYFLSILFYILQLFFLLVLGSSVTNYLLLLGIISGFAIGSESYAYNVISQKITISAEREHFFGTKTSLLNTITLLGVPLLTFIAVRTHSYKPVFILAIIFLFCVLFLIPKFTIGENRTPFRFFALLSIIKTNPDIRNYLLSKYLFGIQNGLFWVVLGIVTFQFVGNIFRWGIFSSMLTLVSIFGAFIYGRTITLRTSKYAAVIATFLFACSTLILAINWSFVYFVVYQIFLAILTTILTVSFDDFVASIIEETKETTMARSELNGIGEFILNLGRFSPIFGLYLLHFSLSDNLFLRVVFIIISSIPLFVISVLKKTVAFSR